MFGQNVVMLYYPSHCENIIQFDFQKLFHLSVMAAEEWRAGKIHDQLALLKI